MVVSRHNGSYLHVNGFAVWETYVEQALQAHEEDQIFFLFVL